MVELKNQKWQDELKKIKCTDETLWQTYKLTCGTKTLMPALQNTFNNTNYFSDQKKAESLVQTFIITHAAPTVPLRTIKI